MVVSLYFGVEKAMSQMVAKCIFQGALKEDANARNDPQATVGSKHPPGAPRPAACRSARSSEELAAAMESKSVGVSYLNGVCNDRV